VEENGEPCVGVTWRGVCGGHLFWPRMKGLFFLLLLFLFAYFVYFVLLFGKVNFVCVCLIVMNCLS
jgi:hypothetical protein